MTAQTQTLVAEEKQELKISPSDVIEIEQTFQEARDFRSI
jgi:hypothetical protein